MERFVVGVSLVALFADKCLLLPEARHLPKTNVSGDR